MWKLWKYFCFATQQRHILQLFLSLCEKLDEFRNVCRQFWIQLRFIRKNKWNCIVLFLLKIIHKCSIEINILVSFRICRFDCAVKPLIVYFYNTHFERVFVYLFSVFKMCQFQFFVVYICLLNHFQCGSVTIFIEFNLFTICVCGCVY